MKNKINEMSGRRTADRKLTEVLLQWVQLRIPRKEAGSGGSSSAVGSVKNTAEGLTKLSSSGSGAGARMLAEAGGREMEEDWSVPLQIPCSVLEQKSIFPFLS